MRHASPSGSVRPEEGGSAGRPPDRAPGARGRRGRRGTRGRAFRRPPLLAASLVLSLAAATGSPAGPSDGPPDRTRGVPAAHAAHAARGTPAPQQQVVLVTGSTGGLGREVARAFADRGAHVLVHGRSVERGEALVAEITAEGRGSARFYRADLASLEEVRDLARRVRGDHDRLDVLVNNAGIYLAGQPRRVTDDGAELHLQVNYLSHVLLTRELLPLLRAAAPSRIVNVASRSQAPLDLDDPMMGRGYSGSRAYRQSKLAQILWTFDLAEALEGSGVTVNAVHPAGAMDTDLVRELGGRPQSTVQEGVESVMRVATGDEVGTGRYFHRTAPARAHSQAYDEEARRRLRQITDRLIGSPAR